MKILFLINVGVYVRLCVIEKRQETIMPDYTDSTSFAALSKGIGHGLGLAQAVYSKDKQEPSKLRT